MNKDQVMESSLANSSKQWLRVALLEAEAKAKKKGALAGFPRAWRRAGGRTTPRPDAIAQARTQHGQALPARPLLACWAPPQLGVTSSVPGPARRAPVCPPLLPRGPAKARSPGPSAGMAGSKRLQDASRVLRGIALITAEAAADRSAAVSRGTLQRHRSGADELRHVPTATTRLSECM